MIPWRGCLVVLLIVAAGGVSGDPATYRVRYDRTTRLQVSAELPAGDGRLLVGTGGGIDHIPDQWASFVKNLRAATLAGEAVTMTPLGKEGWRMDSSLPVRITYDVELSYASGRWPPGNEQAGRQFARSLFTITKPLFVHTSRVTEATVTFLLPAGSAAATPWPARAGANTFFAPSLASLITNTVVLGEFSAARVRAGAFDAIVATPGMDTPPRLVEALRGAGTTASTLFPDTPPGTYLMTFFREESEDGEGYESSGAFTSPDPFDSAGMLVTGNTLVHELLHFWIGHKMAPDDPQALAWFTEGFTEYYANVVLARSGAVEFEAMLDKLSNRTSGYLYFMNSSLFQGVTLSTSGQRKGAHRLGVYDGGWAVAFTLDVMLRSESKGRRSLDDVMRLLFVRHGQTGVPLTYASITAAASEVAQRDLEPFFQKYVQERGEDLPMKSTLAAVGLALRGQPYANDMYLVENGKPTAESLRLRKAMFLPR